MITDKIKALFQFIAFLHSNIENYKQYDDTMNELNLLFKRRSKLKPQNNFNDKRQYKELQIEIEKKINVIKKKIIQPMQAKATELNICDWHNAETFYNWNIKAMDELKEECEEKDVAEIQQFKNKYIEFRTLTNCTYFQNSFFSELDEVLKQLFDFFKDSDQNEFEAFETTPITVNSISEMDEIINNENKATICSPTSFKHDISELCNDCHLIDRIKNGIKNKIEREAKEQQEILTPEQFKQYLNDEIKSAQNAMKKAKAEEENTGPNDYYRHNRIELYIWNKERIKKLNEFLENELNKALPHQQNENVLNNETENDVTLSTIEDWLFEFKDKGVLTGANYNTLVSALYDYLKTGQFPIIENEIKVGRVNKKLFGWNLNRILHHEGKGVETDLLLFAKNNISIFKDVEFDLCDIKKSNLYKYFTTQTK